MKIINKVETNTIFSLVHDSEFKRMDEYLQTIAVGLGLAITKEELVCSKASLQAHLKYLGKELEKQFISIETKSDWFIKRTK